MHIKISIIRISYEFKCGGVSVVIHVVLSQAGYMVCDDILNLAIIVVEFSPPLDAEYSDQRRSRQRSGTLVASDEMGGKYLSRGGGPIFDRSRQRSHSAAPAEILTDRERLERNPGARGAR